MIQVSNEFKKAIKKPEREIKGYVEVLYDLPSQSYTPTVSIQSTYSSLEDLSNGSRVKNLYGSLDYLPLNGSYITMDDSNNENIGYISDDIADEYRFGTFGTFIYSFENPITIKGITVYTRTNIVTDYTIVTIKSDNTQTTYYGANDKEIIKYIYDSPVEINSVYIIFNNVEDWNKKIYVEYIDLGVSQVYKNQDLIEFTIDEEVNKLVEEVPVNETNVILNNINDLFNPLNPTGIVPYLSENTLIKPYIGVLTDTLGVEYVKMGEFYFDSYTNNSDATTTLVGKNIIIKLNQERLKNDNEINIFSLNVNKQKFQNYLTNFNYEFRTLDYNYAIGLIGVNSEYLIDLLRDISFINSDLLYGNRNNELNLKTINKDVQDILTKNELINDANYKKMEKINTLIYNYQSKYYNKNELEYEIYSTSIKLQKSPQYVLCKSKDTNMAYSIITQTGGTNAELFSKGFYLCFAKITGTIGNNVTISVSTLAECGYSNITDKKTIKKSNEKENIIEFNTKLICDINNINTLNYTPSYEMKFDYNGDPSLEAGDYINVETPYGYKSLFIQKNYFKFDGGLEGSIEGVE